MTPWNIKVLAGLNILLFLYVLISALNARSDFNPNDLAFERRESYIAWLPHSFAAAATWEWLWKHLGLTLSFWAIRDWLITKTGRERFLDRQFQEKTGSARQTTLEITAPELPDRVRRLLWILCINGGILALEAILQRLSGTNKLLWILEPYWRKRGVDQFGPYAYRTNAAQYLNLIWPVCLGFWLTLRKNAAAAIKSGGRVGSQPYVVLVPFAALALAGPFISASRGGAIIAFVLLLPVTALFWSSIQRSEIYPTRPPCFLESVSASQAILEAKH